MDTRRYRRSGLLAVLCLTLVFPLGGAVADNHLTLADARFEDPVVLTGADAPSLTGIEPGEAVAFRWSEGAWEQIPVQVDERHSYDLRSAYPPPGEFSCAGGVQCFAPPSDYTRAQGTWYSDPGTRVGADPDPTLDADDEIVFMARDTGEQRPAGAQDPSGVVAATGVEIRVTEPEPVDLVGGPLGSQVIEGFAYLFQHDGSLDPSAGKDYVDYQFNLYKLLPNGQLDLDEDGEPQLGANYLTDYRHQGGPLGNPEDSWLTTPYYNRTFTNRWTWPELRITRGDSTGADILDRMDSGHDWLIATNVCIRYSGTYNGGEGAFVANIDGPVRAIREFVGANSGPLVQVRHVFYDARTDIYSQIRVHAFYAPTAFVDLSEEAIGMIFRSPVAPQGVVVDGIPDPVPSYALPNGAATWNSWDGEQGGLTAVRRYWSDEPDPEYTMHYRDLGVERTYCSGDQKVLGATGYSQGAAMLTSDAADDSATDYDIEAETIFFVDAPGGADGPTRLRQYDNPMTLSTTEL